MGRRIAVILIAAALLAAAILVIQTWVLPSLGDRVADIGLVTITAVITAAVTSAVWAIPIAVGRHHRKRNEAHKTVAALRRQMLR